MKNLLFCVRIKKMYTTLLCMLMVLGVGQVYACTEKNIEKNNGAQNFEEKKSSVYFIILAGGSGERLWPLSKTTLPKQLLSVNGDTFLTQAINRVVPLAQSSAHVWVVTTALYEQAITDAVGHRVGNVIVEPEARNTGAAILYSCLELADVDPDAVVVFLPADAFIDGCDNALFADNLASVIAGAQSHNVIGIMGVEPTYPATGYGYIEFDGAMWDQKNGLYHVSKFHEKPSLPIAQDYIKRSNMLWNIGIFCAPVRVLLEHFKKHVPHFYEQLCLVKAGTFQYKDITSVAVEPAIIEVSDQVWVRPAHFSWCDIGNMDIFLTLKNQFSELESYCILVNSENNVIDVPHKLVTLLGVSDLCVVETEGELLIAKRSDVEKIKLIVQQIRQKGDVRHL